MNPERPRHIEENSNVIDFAAEKAKREEAAKENKMMMDLGTPDVEKIHFSGPPLFPPITADELEGPNPLPPRND